MNRSAGRVTLGLVAVVSAAALAVSVFIPRSSSQATGPVSTWGDIMIAGGLSSTAALSSIDLYDPAANVFAVSTPSMNTARSFAAAVQLTIGPNAGRVLIIGGSDPVANALKTTELYDPASDTFASAGSTAVMNTARYNHTATVIPSGPNAGKVLVVGGFDNFGSIFLASTELYDPVSNSFAAPGATATMSVGRVSHTATTITFGPNGGKILIAGGITTGQVAQSSTELYDPVANTFGAGPSMTTARYEHTATLISTGPDAGKILIAGGNPDSTNTTDEYDPVANSFSAGPEMNAGRATQTASQIAVGPNAGGILMAGGDNSGVVA
ncbi:MAG TPA: kelch repeat-containing protein, partial [Candidatus Binataceae bacterium]|nr:kelch repeat-containing protein [Candidatus Binataceae bacterium]